MTYSRSTGTDIPDPGAVEKAMMVIEVLGRSTGMGLSELSRTSGVPKTTCLRILQSLVAGGFVTKAQKRYRLGWRIIEVGRGAPFFEPGGLRDIAQPHLSELQQRSGQSVSLAVLADADVFYLTRIHRANTLTLPGGEGSRVPATCTAVGKALLAFEPEERRRVVLAAGLRSLTPHSITSPRLLEEQFAATRSVGLAIDHQEAAVGVISMAAPVLHGGRAVAAISASGRAYRQPDRSLDGLLRKAVAATASDYSRFIRQTSEGRQHTRSSRMSS